MHHSRNTEQKQWDETLVLALNGTTKVLRSHLPLLVRLDMFPATWSELMQVRRGGVGACICCGWGRVRWWG